MDRPIWLKPNYTEPRVAVATRDFCGPGTTTFDVGANFGGITTIMSRAVGLRGAVYAFEANPGICKRCQDAVNEAGCSNVQILNAAIYNRSGEKIDLYLSDNMVADSIHYKVSDRSISVPTLALDDFVDHVGLAPSFVKMDIEGAEYEALLGFEKTIATHRPTIILEQTPSETRCLALLRKHGYVALDLSTYEYVETMSDLPPETVVTDILFGQPEHLHRKGYRPGSDTVKVFDAGAFRSENAHETSSEPFYLESGRYIVQANYTSEDSDAAEVFVGVHSVSDGEPIMQHHGSTNSLSKLAHRWVFQTLGQDVKLFFRFPPGRPESFRVSSVQISRVRGIAVSGAVLP